MLIISVFSPFALIWMIKAFAIDAVAQKISRKRLPGIGEKLNLKHIKSDYIKEFGELKGSFQGYLVRVLPYESLNAKIIITLHNNKNKLHLSLKKPIMTPDKGMIDFSGKRRKYNTTFKTKRVKRSIVDKIKNNARLMELLENFYTTWIFKLDGFILESEIICTFRYGFNLFPYIPASKLEALVKDLVVIAEEVDRTVL